MSPRRHFPITHPAYDGKGDVRIGHGDACVLVQIDKPGNYAGIVLTSERAKLLGKALIQQARYAGESPGEKVSGGRG